ncbi:MAG: type II toxin-antitoxin system VapC family toxin [Bryobacterales bacterium]|nr:type II toxin-antitoxin system VapC family toxin [Bryobacterales bacterium]
MYLVVVDASALVAVLQNKPEFRDFACAMPVASVLRTPMVVGAWIQPDGLRDLGLLTGKARVGSASVDNDQALVVRRAFMRSGRASHPYGLSLGDVFACAVAAERGGRLLCEGNG